MTTDNEKLTSSAQGVVNFFHYYFDNVGLTLFDLGIVTNFWGRKARLLLLANIGGVSHPKHLPAYTITKKKRFMKLYFLIKLKYNIIRFYISLNKLNLSATVTGLIALCTITLIIISS